MLKTFLFRTGVLASTLIASLILLVSAAGAKLDPPLNGKIAFSSFASSESDIWVMNAHGGNQTNLTPEFGGNDFNPAWSPDGTKIAFTRGTADIFVINADGTGEIRLTNFNSLDTSYPDWSPDGTRIAFNSPIDGNGEIYVMNADGSGVTQLTDTVFPMSSYQSAWSPDGTKIAFVRNPGEFGSVNDIYVMNADGNGVTQLTSAAASVIGNISPTWSPDGTKIAFDSDRDGNREIYVMNSDGSGPTNLTNSPADDTFPDWSPDGKLILFSSNRDGVSETFYTLQVADPSVVKKVTKGPTGSEPDWQRR